MGSKYPPLRAHEIHGLGPDALVQILRDHLSEAVKLSDILAAAITMEAERRYLGEQPHEAHDPPRDPQDR